MMTGDIYRIDKMRARRSFGRAADSYNAAAILQKQVREEMLSRLDLVKLKPQTILDAGCGTGLASLALQRRYQHAGLISLDFAHPMLEKTRRACSSHGLLRQLKSVVGLAPHHVVCGDIEALPVADASVDFVWSNLAIQWCNDLDAALGEFYRVMRPESLLMFSTFGPDTLRELRAAADAASGNQYTSVSRFIDMHDIGDALVRAGFSTPVLDVERLTLTYADVKSVMQDLKRIGAHNATDGRARGLMGKTYLNRLSDAYEQFRSAGVLPATFEVVYAHAWRGPDKALLPDGVSPIQFKPRHR